jgi:hypothetical protein
LAAPGCASRAGPRSAIGRVPPRLGLRRLFGVAHAE